MKYLCNKDLFMDDGERTFTAGKVYDGEYIDDGMMFVDDQNEDHWPGEWIKHFTIQTS